MEFRQFMQRVDLMRGQGFHPSSTFPGQPTVPLRRAVLEQGFAGRLLRWWRRRSDSASRLVLVDRVEIGPRQALLLVEADGVRLLVATAAEGATTFFALSEAAATSQTMPESQPHDRATIRARSQTGTQSRVSW